MQKKNLEVGSIYNLAWYKTVTVPVRIVKIGTYRAVIEYLDKNTFEPKPVPNPRVYGATTESVPFNMILEKVVA